MSSPISVSSLLQAFGMGGASNIDVNSIVSQLVAVDSQPLYDLQSKVSGYQTKISAYGSLLSSLSSLNTAVTAMQNSTVGMSATSSNTSYFTATATNTAAAAITSLHINSIASAQSINSTRFGSSTAAVADLSGNPTQQLQIQVGNTTSKITINSSNNTLSGIASAINSANAGVTASVVTQSPNFVIDSTNNIFYFDDGAGHYFQAKLTAGNYSGTTLASALQSAMQNAAPQNGGTIAANTFSVDYGTTVNSAFTIKNNSASTYKIDWGTASTYGNSSATPQQFGFALPADIGSPAYQSAAITTATPLSSAVVNGTYELALTSNTSGTANRFTVKADETGGGFTEAAADTDRFGLSVLAFDPTYDSSGVPSGGIYNAGTPYSPNSSGMSQGAVGLDANFTMNGVAMYRSTNTVTDALTGVTLNLLQAQASTDSSNLSLTVSTSSSALAANLSSFVTAYNSAMQTVNGLYNPVTATTTAAQQQAGQGYLNGDSELLTLQQQLQTVPTTMYGTSKNTQNNSLAALGITTDKNGVMSFNSSTLSSAYTTANASDITKTINNFASQLGATLNNAVKTAIPAEQQDVQNLIKYAQSQETMVQERLTYEQLSLTTEYTALANYVANAGSISSYLTTQTGLLTKKS